MLISTDCLSHAPRLSLLQTKKNTLKIQGNPGYKERKKESEHEKANLSERNGGVKRGVKFAATNFKTHLRHIKPNFTLP